MTLSELYEIRSALEFGKYVDSYFDECDKALEIVDREIRLKELEALIPKEDPKEWR